MSENSPDVLDGKNGPEEPFFDSKDIGKKEKPEYFVKVEGAEERKRQAEKDAKKAQERQVRSIKKRTRLAKIKRLITKHKVFFICIMAVLFLAVIALVAFLVTHPPTSKTVKQAMQSIDNEEATYVDFENELSAKAQTDEYSFEDILRWGEEQIEATEDNHKKFAYYDALAYFAVDEEDYYDRAVDYALKLEELAQDDGERYLAYMTISTIYSFVGDMEKSDQYYQKLDQVDEPMKKKSEEMIHEGAQ